MKADRVVITTVEQVDPSAGVIIDQCLSEQPYSFTTDNPDTDVLDDVVSMVYLDPGCSENFVHQMIGTQWWYKDVLVKAEMTTYVVNIQDHGYEWYEFTDDFAECNRVTSMRKDSPDAQTFIQYDVTTTTTTYQVDTWLQKKQKDAGPSPAPAGGGTDNAE
jgi:hypothetical protein